LWDPLLHPTLSSLNCIALVRPTCCHGRPERFPASDDGASSAAATELPFYRHVHAWFCSHVELPSTPAPPRHSWRQIRRRRPNTQTWSRDSSFTKCEAGRRDGAPAYKLATSPPNPAPGHSDGQPNNALRATPKTDRRGTVGKRWQRKQRGSFEIGKLWSSGRAS